jgi:DNA-binding NarL/FixJ family response regulator
MDTLTGTNGRTDHATRISTSIGTATVRAPASTGIGTSTGAGVGAGDRVPVLVQAVDPISRSGVVAALRYRPEITLVDPNDADADTVVIVIADRLTDAELGGMRALRSSGMARIVLVLTEIDDSDLLAAVELGVRAITRRADATPEAMVELARTAGSGAATLPPDLLSRLLTQVSRLHRHVLQPRGLDLRGMSEREREVLRLVAAGLDTKEIAERLCYSQRTIKTILHDVTNRFQLRNRSHAVAYALREGLL